jgi:hypothetical protein
MMDRQAFITYTLALLATPLAVEAQSPARAHRIGFLGSASLSGYAQIQRTWPPRVYRFGCTQTPTTSDAGSRVSRCSRTPPGPRASRRGGRRRPDLSSARGRLR